jgi:hypothetical protein
MFTGGVLLKNFFSSFYKQAGRSGVEKGEGEKYTFEIRANKTKRGFQNLT